MEIPPGTTTINVTIEDDAGFHVAFDASFILEDGGNPHDGWHCNEANMSPPQGAKHLSIAIEGPVVGNVECLDDGLHVPTQGSITSTFRHTLQGTVD